MARLGLGGPPAKETHPSVVAFIGPRLPPPESPVAPSRREKLSRNDSTVSTLFPETAPVSKNSARTSDSDDEDDDGFLENQSDAPDDDGDIPDGEPFNSDELLPPLPSDNPANQDHLGRKCTLDVSAIHVANRSKPSFGYHLFVRVCLLTRVLLADGDDPVDVARTNWSLLETKLCLKACFAASHSVIGKNMSLSMFVRRCMYMYRRVSDAHSPI